MSTTAERNLTFHKTSISRDDLARLNGHRGATVWLTGLSAAGKSTLANAAAKALHDLGVRTFVLDGDNVRHGLNKDLGFSPEDRKENIRRIGEVAKLLTEAGVVNFAAFISPYREDRQVARDIQVEGDFLEVHVDCNLDVCAGRDPKGIYKKAKAGLIPEFTGISAPYENPKDPEIYVNTGSMDVDGCVGVIIQALVDRQVIPPLYLPTNERPRAAARP